MSLEVGTSKPLYHLPEKSVVGFIHPEADYPDFGNPKI